MTEIRFQISEELDKIIKDVSSRIGISKPDIGRIALINYVKDLGAFENKVKGVKKGE